MKKRNLIIIAGLILTIGLLLYFAKTTFLKGVFQGKTPKQAIAKQPAPGHIGHGGGELPQSQPQTSKSQGKTQEEVEEEAPTVEILPEKQQLIGVKIADVSVKPLLKTIRTAPQFRGQTFKL